MNLIAFLLLTFAVAQDAAIVAVPNPPRVISPAQELLLLRALVAQQSNELSLLKYKAQGSLEGPHLLALEALAVKAQQETNSAVESAQKADKATGCRPSLLPKPIWTCEAKK